jgi:hypothetical protein
VSGGGIVGTGSTPYLAYWKGLTAIGSTNQPGSLGFYFDSGSKYAINANTVSTAALSIFNHTIGTYITPPVLSSIGTTLLTQVNGNFQNQYDLSQGFIYYYSGTSTNPNINLIVSKLSTTGGVNESFEFLPGNYGDHASNTTSRKVIISDNGIRSGYISTTTGIEAVAGYHFHAGANGNSLENGTIAWDGRTSGTLAITVPSAFTSWTMTLPGDAGSSGRFLQTDGAGGTTWSIAGGGGGAGVTGSGTTNYFPRWTGVSTLSTTSSIYEVGGNIGLFNTTPSANLHIDRGTGQTSSIKFSAGTTTGTSSTSGFDIGLNIQSGTQPVAAIVARSGVRDMNFQSNGLPVLRFGPTNSYAFGGSGVPTRYGEFIHSPWQFGASAGHAEYGRVLSGTATTTSGVFELHTDGTANTARRIDVPRNTMIGFNCDVVAYNVTAGRSYHVRIRGVVRNNGGTTALDGAVTTETIFSNFAVASSASVTADNASDTLQIKVSGVTSQTIRWLATTELYQVSW